MALSSIDCFLPKARKKHIAITFIDAEVLSDWKAQNGSHFKQQIEAQGFTAKARECLTLFDPSGDLAAVIAGHSEPSSLYDTSVVSAFLRDKLSADVLGQHSFYFDNISHDDAYLGWALGLYQFNRYKTESGKVLPQLVWERSINEGRVTAFITAISLLRNLVNMPANDLGPVELESAAQSIAALFKGKLKVISGRALEKGFPLVQAVGQAAIKERAPRLIDMSWGKKTDPKLTIVGKGVCFDTGGLDLKPSAYMKLMKKDMGGAAHALGLAYLIMALKLPVQLRVIIPAVENAVGGAAFRPGDVFTSRSGITVENVDTDAEGRLILADALAYAAEDEPDLIIDFATLTGSARAALGQDIPAGFSNDYGLAAQLREVTFAAEDGIWPMPLIAEYTSLLDSSIADTTNHAGGTPGDLIYSALFLQKFLGKKAPKWIHVDCFAWEALGRPGRTKGGKDTGLRGIFALLETLYRG